MKSKYIVAIVATGLLAGSAFAAYGPAPKEAKGCGFDAKGVQAADQFGNTFRSGVKSSICWQDRVAVSGQVGVRYTSTDSDTTDDLDNRFRVNHAAFSIDTAFDSKWSGHFTVADVKLADGTNEVAFDEAMFYFNDSALPFNIKVGYGFTNFGEFNNPYNFVRKPTEVAATNQQAQASVGFAMDGAFAELYAAGTDNVGWGAALGYDQQVGAVGVHTKFGYVANKALDVLPTATNDGGTYDVEAEFALPYGVKVGGSYVKSRGLSAGAGLQMWSVNGAYRFNAAGMPSDLHVWYADNKESTSDLFGGAGSTTRFNTIGYNTSQLDRVWDIGFNVQVSPNIDVSVDYLDSKGTDSDYENRTDLSEYNLVNVALTGRF